MMELENIAREAAAKSAYTSDFYKMKNGSNKMRIMTDFKRVETITRVGGKYGGHVTESNRADTSNPDEKKRDKVRMQGWAWAIIRGVTREQDEFKIIQFGTKILDQVVAYKNNPEYTFTNAPLPYDIDIQTTGAGTMEVVYVVQAARQNTDVTEAEMATLNKKKTIAVIIEAIKNKQDGKSAPTDTTAPVEDTSGFNATVANEVRGW